ncbi:Aminotransferase class V domain [Trinorchestia longiramus]|nr:Aminotransferase class V domain [Trinorchestia longiramus]
MLKNSTRVLGKNLLRNIITHGSPEQTAATTRMAKNGWDVFLSKKRPHESEVHPDMDSSQTTQKRQKLASNEASVKPKHSKRDLASLFPNLTKLSQVSSNKAASSRKTGKKFITGIGSSENSSSFKSSSLTSNEKKKSENGIFWGTSPRHQLYGIKKKKLLEDRSRNRTVSRVSVEDKFKYKVIKVKKRCGALKSGVCINDNQFDEKSDDLEALNSGSEQHGLDDPNAKTTVQDSLKLKLKKSNPQDSSNGDPSTQQSLMIRNSVGMTQEHSSSSTQSKEQVMSGKNRSAKTFLEDKMYFSTKDVHSSVSVNNQKEFIITPKQNPAGALALEKSSCSSPSVSNEPNYKLIDHVREQELTSAELLRENEAMSPAFNLETSTELNSPKKLARVDDCEGSVEEKHDNLAQNVIEGLDDAVVNDILRKYVDVLPKAVKLLSDFYGISSPKHTKAVSITPAPMSSTSGKTTEKMRSSHALPGINLETGENTFTISPVVKQEEPSLLEPQVLIHESDCTTSSACDYGDVVVSDHEVYSDEESSEGELEGKDYCGMEYIRNIRRHIGVTQYAPAIIYKSSGEVIPASKLLTSTGALRNSRLTSDLKPKNFDFPSGRGAQENCSSASQCDILASSSGKLTLSGRPAISVTPVQRSIPYSVAKSPFNMQESRTSDYVALSHNTSQPSSSKRSANKGSYDKNEIFARSCVETGEVSEGVFRTENTTVINEHSSRVSSLLCDVSVSECGMNTASGGTNLKVFTSLENSQTSTLNSEVACPSPSSSDHSSTSSMSNGLSIVEENSSNPSPPPTQCAVGVNATSNASTMASSEISRLTSTSSMSLNRISISNPVRMKSQNCASVLKRTDSLNSSSVTASSMPTQTFLVQPPSTPSVPKPPLLLIRANSVADIQKLFLTKQLMFSSSTSLSSTSSTITNLVTTSTPSSCSSNENSDRQVATSVTVSPSSYSKEMHVDFTPSQKDKSSGHFTSCQDITGGKTYVSKSSDLGFELFPSIKPLSIVLKPSDIVDLKGKTSVKLEDLDDAYKSDNSKETMKPTCKQDLKSLLNFRRTTIKSSVSAHLIHNEEKEEFQSSFSSPTYILPTSCSVSPDQSPTSAVELASSPVDLKSRSDLPGTQSYLCHATGPSPVSFSTVPYSSSVDVTSSESFQEICIKDENICDIENVECNVSVENIGSPEYDVALETEDVTDSSTDRGSIHLNNSTHDCEENAIENVQNTFGPSVLLDTASTSSSSLCSKIGSAIRNAAILRSSRLHKGMTDPLAHLSSTVEACVQPEGENIVTTLNTLKQSDSLPADSSFEVVLNRGVSKPFSSSLNRRKQQLILPKPPFLQFLPIPNIVSKSSDDSSFATTLYIPNLNLPASSASATATSSSPPSTSAPSSSILSPSAFSSGLPTALSPMNDDCLDMPNLSALGDETPERDDVDGSSEMPSSATPVPGPRLTVKNSEMLMEPSTEREKSVTLETWVMENAMEPKMNKLSVSQQQSRRKLFNCDIYLDYNATTPVADAVQDVILKTLKWNWANPSSSYKYGVKAKKVVDKARERVAALLGCRQENIVFTSGGTESNNLAIHSAIEHYLAWLSEHYPPDHPEHDTLKRPHVITTNLEHDSVTRALYSYDDIDLTVLGWRGLMEELPQRVQPNTCLISIMLANNETGIILPVAEIARKKREEISKVRCMNDYFPLLIHTDASQVVGKMNVNVDDLGVDYLTLTGHKFYGPRVGALYVREDRNGLLPVYPLFYGGGQERGIRPGTENTAMIAGLGAACKLASEHMTDYTNKQKKIRAYLETTLKVGTWMLVSPTRSPAWSTAEVPTQDPPILTYSKQLQLKFRHDIKFNCLEPCVSDDPERCSTAHLSLGGAGSALIFPRIPNTTSIAFNHPKVTAKAILMLCPNLMVSVGAACHSSDSVAYENSILKHHGVCSFHAVRTLRLSVGRDTSTSEVDAAVALLQAACRSLVRAYETTANLTAPASIPCSVSEPGMSEVIKLRKLHQLMNSVDQEASPTLDEKPGCAGEESSGEESDV